MEDPRRVLEAAAEQRLPCEVLPRNGSWRRARVIRVERGGIVLTVAGDPLLGGTDVRCWLAVDGKTWTFEASVLRAGVPVPDRSQQGVLLGFLDHFVRAEAQAGALQLDVLPPNGRAISLVEGAAHIVDLSPSELTITAPNEFNLIFVEGGAVRLRLGLPGRAPMEVGARVRALSRGDGHLLYRIGIEAVEDPERYRELVDGLRRALGV
jgi:hypothetical protein